MSLADIDDTAPALQRGTTEHSTTVYRHRWPTRVWHWINVVTLLVMLMSGLMIFNAHPRLYWGAYGANQDQPWLQIGAAQGRGYLRIGGLSLDTTGVLGQSTGVAGNTVHRAFPYWLTIPSSYDLALSRLWHFAFAWIFATGIAGYLIWSLLSRHLGRDLLPTGEELRPRHVWHDIVAHARLRFPTGEAARHYNVLQKFAYLGVLVVLLPTMVLTGLTMSPGMNAAWPWLLDLFGGRQSARSIHFIAAVLIVLFVLVHLAMVVLAGPINEIRSMITGRYRLPEARAMTLKLSRRGLLRAATLGGSGLALAGCNAFGLATSSGFQDVLASANDLTYRVQRLLVGDALAPEFGETEMSPVFRTNGNTMPASATYQALASRNFAGWSLAVDGLVERPGRYSLDELRAMPSRTQITRHDCVEGWSAIGKWTGVPLRRLLDEVGLKPAARYVVFHCADDFDGTSYYESIDVVDARHPQTMLAYAMNGQTLSIGHGAPLRLRVERQLGYKQAKYVMRIEAVSSLLGIGGGHGGYWEDSIGYDWYAGI